MARKGIFELRNSKTGKVTERPVDIPEDIIYPLKAYLGEIPGYDTALDYNKQKSDDPRSSMGSPGFILPRPSPNWRSRSAIFSRWSKATST